MHKTKVYMPEHGYFDTTPHLYFNPGEAKFNRSTPNEYELAHEEDLSSIIDRCPITVHAIVTNDDEGNILRTPYCLTEVMAEQFALEMKFDLSDYRIRRRKAELWNPYLKPMKCPIDAYLYPGDKGLYTHLNLHPEIDGKDVRGKIFFPDKRCAANLCAGPAVITEIKDKGNYGFFMAHMRQFANPDEAALDKFLSNPENAEYLTGGLKYMSGKFGEYIVLMVESQKYHRKPNDIVESNKMLFKNGDDLDIEMTGLVSHDTDVRTVKCISVADYLCEGYHDCKFDDLMNKFDSFKLADRYPKSVDRFISNLFDDAMSAHMVQLHMWDNILYASVSRTHIIANLTAFSREEMSEIIAEVNKINQAANDKLAALVKHGKIRLT